MDERWTERVRRIATSPQAPALTGGILGAIALVETVERSALHSFANGVVLGLALFALATTLPLALLRTTAAAVTVTIAAGLSLALFQTLTVAGMFVQLIVLYRLGRNGSQRDGALLGAAGLAMPFLVLAALGSRSTVSEASVLTLLLAGLAPVAVWSGIALRARIEARMHSAARQAVAGTLLEHTARGERARIARELHDVVAHHISMVAVQAETARLTTPGMPAAGAQRLSAIGDTARAALTEMRRLLGVLRDDSGADVAVRRPQPGLGQLTDLLDEARAASGSGTRLILRGSPVVLDPGVELAAYRIVQEALTNSRRHAPGAAVDVELHYTDDALLVRIRDNGPGPPAAALAGGHGLLGMNERAAAVGGTLRTGSATGTGFLVEAVLPTKTEANG